MKTTVGNHRIAMALLVIIATASISGAVQAQQKDRHFGPTGIFGTINKQQIQVTKVEKGSPADGKVRVGDVILGAGGAPFKGDIRREFADAIDQAETPEGKGILTLKLKSVALGTLKSAGKSAEVTHAVDMQLKVLGAYSDTAPYNCPKTDAIITQAADYLVKSKKFGRMDIGLLGLLATGEQKYVDVVKGVIHQAEWASPDIKLELQGGGYTSWSWGYINLVLCEYYLLTGDKYVLPAIKAYSVAAAMGRDAGGLWGHRMANPEINGGNLHGRLYGYAQMNQPSLSMFISLLLADKCGIRHPELQAAIKQVHTFYISFIDKGTLPYGVHNPNSKSFNNNGMSGSAAVAFSLLGNARGAAFFSRMSTAAHNTMETGHTGHYFNQLWTGLGANLAGPEASEAFFKQTRWLHTLNRTWDGGFTYDDAGGGTFGYRGCSDAGSHLLNYCLARHKLYITGRDADTSIWLKGKEVSDTIGLATMDPAGKSDEELLAMFGHPMPKIRGQAVWTLRSRQHKLMGAITKMLKKGTELQRQSAIEYFGYGCPAEQVAPVQDDLASIMLDPKEDMSVRAAAAGALCCLGEPAYKYFNDMLKIIVADKPEDTLGRIDEDMGGRLNLLCKDPYAAGLVTDKKLFYKAVHTLLDHRRASGRTAGVQLIAHVPLEDFHYVADKVMYIIEDKDITYHSYHNLGPLTGAIGILASLNIEGGIEAAFKILDTPGGKAGFEIKMLLAVLPKYGANAKYALPRIKAVTGGKFQKQWDAMIKQIESATGTRKMISFAEAKRAGAKGKTGTE